MKNKHIKCLLAISPLVLASCAEVKSDLRYSMDTVKDSFSNWLPEEGPELNLPQLVMVFQNPDAQNNRAVIELTTKNPKLAEFLTAMVRRGYYNDQYFYREVPGAYVLTGKARLSGRPTVAGPYVDIHEKGKKPPETGRNEVGMVVHMDGTVGPELMLKYNVVVRDQETQPANIRVGRILEGADALAKVRKGDKVTQVYFQNPGN